MAVIYATLIVKGKKTFAQVPVKLQEQVRQVLIDLECEELIGEQENVRSLSHKKNFAYCNSDLHML